MQIPTLNRQFRECQERKPFRTGLTRAKLNCNPLLLSKLWLTWGTQMGKTELVFFCTVSLFAFYTCLVAQSRSGRFDMIALKSEPVDHQTIPTCAPWGKSSSFSSRQVKRLSSFEKSLKCRYVLILLISSTCLLFWFVYFYPWDKERGCPKENDRVLSLYLERNCLK